MADVLGAIADAATKVGSKLAVPQSGDAAGIKAKADNVKEYMDAVAQKPAPSTSAPAPGVSADRISKGAKFGDRGKEKRFDVSSMTKPLVSYKTGTASVPKTGPALLHKGEAVIPSESNPMNAENWAGKIVDSEKPPKKLDYQKVRRAKTGGHIIEHHHTHPGHHPMEEHVKANVADMAQHMTDSNNDPSGAGDPAAGAAASAAAAV